MYEATGEPVQAAPRLGEGIDDHPGLADGIKDETLRARFLAGPQIQPVLQYAWDKTLQGLQEHTKQS